MLTKKLIIQEFKALPGWSRGLEIRNGRVGQSQEIQEEQRLVHEGSAIDSIHYRHSTD